MSNEAIELTTVVENELPNLTAARSMLEEASYDLSKVITGDKSKEDEERIRNLLRRRERLLDFVYIAMDYIDRTTDTLRSRIEQSYKVSGEGG